jgi:hypothetical protein
VALRGGAALLDGIELSVIDFWQVYRRSAGAEQAFEFLLLPPFSPVKIPFPFRGVRGITCYIMKPENVETA